MKKAYGLFITRKTIYRYMKLHAIQSVIRKKKKKYGKFTHHGIPSLIKRNFEASRPMKNGR